MKLGRAALVGVALLALSARGAEELRWHEDLDQARTVAAKEHKLLLVNFTGSTWCGPCKALEAQVLTQPEFADFAHDLVLVRLDYPRGGWSSLFSSVDPRLAGWKQRYGVPGYPTMLYLDAEGEERGRLVGYRTGVGPARYLEMLRQVRRE